MLECQIRHLYDDEREILVSGSAGSGKTFFACTKTLMYALDNPGASVFCYRRFMPDLKKTTLRTIRQILHAWNVPYQENKSEGLITLENGSQLYFSSLDDPDKVRSINADFIMIEQMEQIPDFATYSECMMRLGRGEVSKSEGCYAQMLAIVQPDEPGHWIYKRFFEFNDVAEELDSDGNVVRSYDEVLESVKKERKVIHFSYLDNYYLPRKNREYYDSLKNVDETLYRRYALGEWVGYDGLIFSNYDTYCDREDFDFYTAGVDFGFNHPNVFLLIGWFDDEAYILDEVYESELVNNEFISKSKELLFKHKLLPSDLHTVVCDAARPDAIMEFSQAGFPAEAGIKDVKRKIETSQQTRIHIHPRCRNTIDEIKNYSWKVDKRTGECLEEPVKNHDDAMDAMMYCIYEIRGYMSPGRMSSSDDYFDKIMVF